jgi:hypothetical protein
MVALVACIFLNYRGSTQFHHFSIKTIQIHCG